MNIFALVSLLYVAAVSGQTSLYHSTLITVVGTPNVPGYSGDGGLATEASVDFPSNVAVDSSGNIYVCGFFNNVVRYVDAQTGIISTYAGNGNPGFSGDGGLALEAELYNPSYSVLNSVGDLYVTTFGVVRVVNKATQIISTLNITSCPNGLAIDSQDNLYYTDRCLNQIFKVDTTGVRTLIAGVGGFGAFGGDGYDAVSASLSFPNGISLDSSGNIYFSDMLNHRIRVIDATTGIISTIAGNGIAGSAGLNDLAINSQVGFIYDVAVYNNILYLAVSDQHTVLSIDPSTGILQLVAGVVDENGVGIPGYNNSTSQLNTPFGISPGPDGVYVSDTGNFIVRKIV